jgi:hypothetical protein
MLTIVTVILLRDLMKVFTIKYAPSVTNKF